MRINCIDKNIIIFLLYNFCKGTRDFYLINVIKLCPLINRCFVGLKAFSGFSDNCLWWSSRQPVRPPIHLNNPLCPVPVFRFNNQYFCMIFLVFFFLVCALTQILPIPERHERWLLLWSSLDFLVWWKWFVELVTQNSSKICCCGKNKT